MRSTRIDSGTVSQVRNDNGILQARVNLSRVGVFPYVYSDGRIVKEAKLPDQLFSPQTIESANGAVITDQHPAIKTDSDTGLVDNTNYQLLSKGNVYNVKRDSDFLAGVEKIYDAELAQKISNGEQVQVSIGFTADIDWTPGEFNGEKYDCIQKNIRINHVAHVDEGRAGESCRVLLDSKQNLNYAIMQELNAMPIVDHTDKKEKKLTLRVDGKDIQVSKQTMDAIRALALAGLTVKLDADPEPAPMAPTGEVTPTGTDAPVASDQPLPDMAAIQEKLKMADQILNTIQTKYSIGLEELMSLLEAKDEMIKVFQSKMPVQMAAAVADDRRTIRRANAVLPELKTDSMSTRQVKEEVIKTVMPDFKGGKFDGLSDTEIEIGFESAMTLSQFKAQNVSSVKSDSAESSTRLDELQKEYERAKQNFYNRGRR